MGDQCQILEMSESIQ
jgi:hypothetical protein